MAKVASWGRLHSCQHELHVLSDRVPIEQQLHADKPGLAFGRGRSYGDVCLNPDGVLWLTSGLDKFIHFDEASGMLRCESGVSLRDIQRVFVPRGWMLPVSPGTQLVSVGGAIANDVHGKNHHVHGSFGDHVHRIVLKRTDGSSLECAPHLQPDWFRATVGGLGLTGVISEADIQLRRVEGPWLDAETIPFQRVDEFFPLADASEAEFEYTVAWIDCTSGEAGRGLLMRANHNSDTSWPVTHKAPRTMPLVPPVSLVNALSLKPFNALYYHSNRMRDARAHVFFERFFYPLDNLLEWNRMYGPRGFYQYQSVVPRAAGADATKEMLRQIAKSGEGSFLAVLKTFGARAPLGMLSFPMPGVTLALDFPNRGTKTHALFERLDAVVREAGGRLYPAKDARMPRQLFEAGYAQLGTFLPFRDPGISSAMSRRLLGS
ncbi:FAD-binding oxidoreductase [Dyella acidiphila]|uniref:FAD-binding oxidoreductase n=1 Tax=Dyella acidiphila TaxID=2775866 RepID=A0ABR9G546_9GAMM|nr:FAD-binding oxidoreductase [Dyella acidiphila]